MILNGSLYLDFSRSLDVEPVEGLLFYRGPKADTPGELSTGTKITLSWILLCLTIISHCVLHSL